MERSTTDRGWEGGGGERLWVEQAGGRCKFDVILFHRRAVILLVLKCFVLGELLDLEGNKYLLQTKRAN